MKSKLSPDNETVLKMETEYWHLVEIGDIDGYFSFWKEGSITWPPGLDEPSYVNSKRLKEQELEDVEMYLYRCKPKDIQTIENVAMVYFEVTVLERASGHEIATSKGVHIWMKHDEHWQLIGGMGA